MPTLPVWFAGLTVIPATSYTLYQYVYIPRTTTQTEMERLSDAAARPRQLLESDLVTLGGQSAKLSAWTTPHGQRDTPHVSFIENALKTSEIPNSNRFDCDLPPYHQPSGVLPQTNAEKTAMFGILQFLRLALIASCPNGDVRSDTALQSMREEGQVEKALAMTSLWAQFAPNMLSRDQGMLVSTLGSTSSGRTCITSSKATEMAAVSSSYKNMSDAHREEILRRIAHTEMTKLFLLGTEGDMRFITPSRIARHAKLPRIYDTLIIPPSIEAVLLGKVPAQLVGGERKDRFLTRREDGLLVPKPLHLWVRRRADDNPNKSGTVTTIDEEYQPEVDAFSPASSAQNTIASTEKALPNRAISVQALQGMLRSWGKKDGESTIDMLRREGFSRLLISPYLRFRDGVLSRDERVKSAIAFTLYNALFRSTLSEPPRKASMGAHSAVPSAMSPSSFIADIIVRRTDSQVVWGGPVGLGAPIDGTSGAAALLATPCAYVAYKVACLFGLVPRRYADEWRTDLRYALADWAVHRLLEIDTTLMLSTDGGLHLDTLATNGVMVAAEGDSDAKRRIDREWRRGGRGYGDVLLTIAPALWIEELGLYAAAGALIAAERKNVPKTAPGRGVNNLAILPLPSATFSTVFDFMLRAKRDEKLIGSPTSRLRIGTKLFRSDLFPIGVSGMWDGFPCAPSPVDSAVYLRLQATSQSTLDSQETVTECEMMFRPVAVLGTAKITHNNPSTSNDPLLYSFPDAKIAASGIDTQNVVDQLGKRGLGSDDNVFVSDARERERLLRASKILSVGSKVGQGSKKQTTETGETTYNTEATPAARSIEEEVWHKERMIPSGLDLLGNVGPIEYNAFRRGNVQAANSVIGNIRQRIDARLFNDAVFGGRTELPNLPPKRGLTFTIGAPTTALATLSEQSAKESDLVIQFSSAEHLQSLLSAIVVTAKRQTPDGADFESGVVQTFSQ